MERPRWCSVHPTWVLTSESSKLSRLDTTYFLNSNIGAWKQDKNPAVINVFD